MQLLKEYDFLNTRNHTTCAIMGCGGSINTITDKQWKYLKDECDTFAFNWYCMKDTPIIPTYYAINAQGIRKKEIDTPYDWKNFLQKIKCKYKVILTNHLKKNNNIVFHYDHNLDIVEGVGAVVHQRNFLEETVLLNPFSDGAYNGMSSIGFVCHMAIWLGYSKIIFFGIDLYDQSYFWDNGKVWEFLAYDLYSKNGDHKRDHLHASAPSTVEMMEKILPLTPAIQWMVHNPDSLLANTIPVWTL